MNGNQTLLERTRILALNFKADDLIRDLKKVLEETPSFGFEIQDHALSESELDRGTSVDLSRAAVNYAPHLAVLCLSQAGTSKAKAVFEMARRQLGTVPIVFVAETSDPENWRDLLHLGPEDFIASPFRPIDVLPRLWRLHPARGESDPTVVQLKEKLGLKQLIGESAALLAEVRKIPALARCDASVLITGETGTGKEMFARAIHFLSARSGKTFSPLNCGAVPIDLLENELFGHEAGAFTGANSSAIGLLRETDGGSLFLDEVDCLPLQAQVKLLRFLQDKEFRSLGAHRSSRADVRVIAASNANLEEAVKKGRFRQDLYYRLNVVSLVLPPLRERKEDIPLLARHFVAKYAGNDPLKKLAAAALQKLLLYDWPGNVRELENVIQRSVILSFEETIRSQDIKLPMTVSLKEEESFRILKAKTIAQFERGYILDLLRAHNGNITRAARAARKPRRAFWEIIRKHGLNTRPEAPA